MGTEAADLGLPEAHCDLGRLYMDGEGVKRNTCKALRHFAAAAKGGHPDARFGLGYWERMLCRMDKALKHFTIAAKMGDEQSLNAIKEMHVKNNASKDHYREALFGYREATNAMKSEQRRKALGSREQRYASLDEVIAKDNSERERARAEAQAERVAAELLQEMDLEDSTAQSKEHGSGSSKKGKKKK